MSFRTAVQFFTPHEPGRSSGKAEAREVELLLLTIPKEVGVDEGGVIV